MSLFSNQLKKWNKRDVNFDKKVKEKFLNFRMLKNEKLCQSILVRKVLETYCFPC